MAVKEVRMALQINLSLNGRDTTINELDYREFRSVMLRLLPEVNTRSLYGNRMNEVCYRYLKNRGLLKDCSLLDMGKTGQISTLP
jgi:hypothetical protein